MSDSDPRREECQIAQLVARSVLSFKTLISALGEDHQARVPAAASHLARFKLWAGRLGAHRPSGTRSLEYRLRDASFIRNHVVSLPEHLKGYREGIHPTLTDSPGLGDNRSETSGTSYASSNTSSDQLRVPPLPKEYIDGPFKCPFCQSIVSIDTRGAWR